MPGTIQVSVLGLVGLPSSSISVKVSMGKKEYQTWDKGEFYFPLTALRDNLIVTLHDAEGNELSLKEVETRLIVEKGILDDLLTLEGGAHLRVKYQFILTEDDRKRIREMRDSALRKKRGELLACSPRQSESESVSPICGEVAMPSISLNNEVTDSRKRADQMEAVSAQGRSPLDPPILCPVTHVEELNTGPGNRKDTDVGQLVQTSANATEGIKELHQPTLPAEKVKVLHLMEANQRIPTRPSSAEITLDHQLRIPESLVEKNSAPSSLDGQTHFHDKLMATEKIPSNVRKMISAFESSQSQGSTPRDNVSTESFPSMKGPSVKELMAQKNITILSNADVGMKSYSKGKLRGNELQKEDKGVFGLPAQGVCGVSDRMFVSKHVGELDALNARHTAAGGAKTNDESSAAVGTTTNNENNDIIKHRKEGTVVEELSESSRAVTDADLRRINCGHLRDQSYELSQGHQSSSPSIENSNKIDMCATQNEHARQSTGNELYCFESSENLIIPGEKRRVCITTASKMVMNVVKAFDNSREIDQRKRRSSKAVPIKNCCISQEVKKNGKKCHSLIKPKLESSESEKASGGLIGQVVRITIMLAFGTLVLVTRQRNNR